MGIDKKDKFIKTPDFPGGVKGIQQFIKENLRYPKVAFDNKLEATVHVKYVINSKGDVIEAKCVGSAGHGFDEEALRVVKLLKYSSANNRHLRVTFNKKIDIHFRLPRHEDVIEPSVSDNQSINIQYTITPTPLVLEIQTPEKSGGYSYQINIG